MLVLTRKASESIRIADEIEVKVIEVRGSRVRLGIVAPEGVRVVREEVWVDLAASEPLLQSA